MVGITQRFNLHGLRQHISHTISHESGSMSTTDLGTMYTRTRRVPWFASPLDPKTTEWLKHKHESGNLTLKRRPTIAQYEADRFSKGLFRKQHEASTLELFFDLFFVANLAVFTTNYEHSSPQSVGNYIGFFAILWTTWFQYSIFDVRFYVDSQFNRVCKLVSFGVLVSFTGLGPIYDAISTGGQTRAFQSLALVLMVSRLAIVAQYLSVMWFVRSFKKTLVPLGLTCLVYFASAMTFLATYLDDRGQTLSGAVGSRHIRVWYVAIIIEAVLVIVISTIWRVLSFKHTHLVERVGLLTLIIMGEGIIGLTKSVAYMLSGTQIGISSVLGQVISAVMLIYEVYILYFSPIDHDRFGTIRQQFWTLLHFPLHVAILLTEEGSAATLLWTTCISGRNWLRGQLPSLEDPSTGYNNTAQWISAVNNTMYETSKRYDYLKLKDVYDWTQDLYRVDNITDAFGSEAWNEQAKEILGDMFNETTNFIFENFNFEAPYNIKSLTDPNEITQVYFDAYQTIFTFLYIAAGCMLLFMGVMYWLGKNNKTKEEYAAILTRFGVGVGLPFVSIVAYTNTHDGGFVFTQSGWIITIVMFAFLYVVMADNFIDFVADRLRGRHRSDATEMEEGTTEKHHRKLDAAGRALHFGRPAHHAHGEEHEEHSAMLPADAVVSREGYTSLTAPHSRTDSEARMLGTDTSYSATRFQTKDTQDTDLTDRSGQPGVTFYEPTIDSPVISRPEEGYLPEHRG